MQRDHLQNTDLSLEELHHYAWLSSNSSVRILNVQLSLSYIKLGMLKVD